MRKLGATVTVKLPVKVASAMSVTVTVCEPGVPKYTVRLAMPFSRVIVVLGGRIALESLHVRVIAPL